MSQRLILGDWGGTRLRLWLRRSGETLACSEAPGLLVAGDGPAGVLRSALARLGPAAPGCRIVLCGMAGARGGLAEAGYVPCPAGRRDWIGGAHETALDDSRMTILPGLSARNPQGRPDVMRGEEAQVFGALALRYVDAQEPTTIVLPGTHSKWVCLTDGRIVDIATCPTGELHARLLGSSMAPGEPGGDEQGRREGFAAGLDRAREGEPLPAALFEARAGQLLDRRSGDWARGFLSGLLIGSEIAAMARTLPDGACPLLIASAELLQPYRIAFAAFGVDCRTADAEACVLAGLETAHDQPR